MALICANSLRTSRFNSPLMNGCINRHHHLGRVIRDRQARAADVRIGPIFTSSVKRVPGLVGPSLMTLEVTTSDCHCGMFRKSTRNA